MSRIVILHSLRATGGDRAALAQAARRAVDRFRELPIGHRALVGVLLVWSAVALGAALLVLVPTGGDLDEPAGMASIGASPRPAPDFADIAGRPLFARSRRPPPIMPVRASSVTSFKDHSLRVIGIVIDGATSKALLLSAGQPAGVWVKAGDHVGGWSLAAISPREIDLSADGERLVLPLDPLAIHP